jgi:hypothetical protein
VNGKIEDQGKRLLGNGEKIQTSRDCETISKSTVTTNLSPFISKIDIALGMRLLKHGVDAQKDE